LYKNLEEVRQKGYALDDESYVAGVRAIGAPVFNHRGVVDAGINVPVFAHMVSLDDLLQKYLAPLLETAERVSAARGFFKTEAAEGRMGFFTKPS
jgi:IclR family transcriptional regulator, KDG regulon repressor